MWGEHITGERVGGGGHMLRHDALECRSSVFFFLACFPPFRSPSFLCFFFLFVNLFVDGMSVD